MYVRNNCNCNFTFGNKRDNCEKRSLSATAKYSFPKQPYSQNTVKKPNLGRINRHVWVKPKCAQTSYLHVKKLYLKMRKLTKLKSATTKTYMLTQLAFVLKIRQWQCDSANKEYIFSMPCNFLCCISQSLIVLFRRPSLWCCISQSPIGQCYGLTNDPITTKWHNEEIRYLHQENMASPLLNQFCQLGYQPHWFDCTCEKLFI